MTATEARLTSSVPMHRTTVYRLLKRVKREGEQALAERHHGYSTTLRSEHYDWREILDCEMGQLRHWRLSPVVGVVLLTSTASAEEAHLA